LTTKIDGKITKWTYTYALPVGFDATVVVLVAAEGEVGVL
jgi:hypothetical protein